jgi:fringe protein
MDEGQTYFRDEFVNIAKLAYLTDDVEIGFIIEGVMGYNYTNVSTMTSHIGVIKIPQDQLLNQITISYGFSGTEDNIVPNVISLGQNARFDKAVDLTRYSVHQHRTEIYPSDCTDV